MPVIDDFEIPEEIISELARLVDNMPAESIFSYATMHKSVTRGFRPTTANLGIVRQRISESLSRGPQLDPDLRAMLATTGLNQEFIVVLSKTVLDAFFCEFMTIFGRSSFLSALLVDERKDVRKLAIDFFNREKGGISFPEPDENTSRSEIKEGLGPFLTHMSSFLDGETEIIVSRDSQPTVNKLEDNRLRLKISNLEKRISKIKTKSGLDKRLQEKLDKALEQNSELRKRIEREKQGREEAVKELRKAVRRAEELRNELKQSIDEGVRKEMTSAVRGWITRAGLIEMEAKKADEENKSGDILPRVKAILDRQAEIDRQSGNLQTLQTRLKDLKNTKLEIDQTRANALNPLPLLKPLSEELNSEIRRLENILGMRSEDLPCTNAVLTRINEASSGEEMARIREFLNEAGEIGAVNDNDLKKLYKSYHHKLEFMYDEYVPRQQKDKEPVDPAWILKKSITKNNKLTLILDGHNILFNLPDIFVESYENGTPGPDAREKLIGIMIACLNRAPNCEARIFFDGPEPSRTARSHNVIEIYSGGGAKSNPDRADQAIIDFLNGNQVKQNGSDMFRRTIIISDDTDLQKKAQKKGAAIMPLQEFAVLLEELQP